MEIINPFNDVPSESPLPADPSLADILSNNQYLRLGSGDRAFHIDKSGIWLGTNAFADAPFSVDMDGNLVANSGNIATYRRSFITTCVFTVGNTAFNNGNSGNTYFTHGAFFFNLAGVDYSVSANSTGTGMALPSGTIPQNTYGGWAFFIDTAGVYTITAAPNNYTTGYPTGASVVAAVNLIAASPPAGTVLIGKFSGIANNGSPFVANTNTIGTLSQNMSVRPSYIRYTAGTITFSGGTVYNITLGYLGTFDEAQTIYIYLDTDQSLTRLFGTSSVSLAVGSKKSLLNILYTLSTGGSLYDTNAIQG